MKKVWMYVCCLLLGLSMVAGDVMPVWAKENPYQVEVGKYGMTPIYGRDLEPGTHEIGVDSNSKFFKIVRGTITVTDADEMTGTIEIASHSYQYIYLGTKEEAEQASEEQYLIPEEVGDYSYQWTIPVEALNKPFSCAAYSKRKKRWYDRQILFDATTLETGVLKLELPDYDAIEQGLEMLSGTADSGALERSNAGDGVQTYGGLQGNAYTPAEAIQVPFEDGEYSIEVSMTGGTGRTAISSPTLMTVKDGRAYARILMSSSHYDWMIAGGETYVNEHAEDGGNSSFTIPISAMDQLIPIIADTTAMGEPVAIEYTLTFYEETVGNKGQIPQEAAKKVLVVAAVIIIAGGIINHFAKKNKRRSRSQKRRR